jgi:ADP-ribosylglycohydrolase
MRAGILAVAEKLTGTDALVDCKITNPSPACIEAVRLYLDVIKLALDNSDKAIITQFLSQKTAANKDISACISDAINDIRRNITGRDKGWVMHGLYCALWSLLQFDTYHDGIDAVIRLGGDTDTNASISGDMLGAFYGYSKIVEHPVTAYNISVLCTSDSSKGNLMRSKEYEISCLEQLLEKLPFPQS